MNTLTPLYLHKLPQLGEIFSFLNSGKHMNRLADHRLWAELERERDTYEMLFGALGYALRVDERGFAWFYFEEASSFVSKTTRQLALLFMLIFEFQADTGLNLGRFTDWMIDEKLLAALLEKNRILLEAEGLADRELLEQLLKTAGNYGLVTTDRHQWRLLPAVFRYLDRFEELAQARAPEGATLADTEELA
ncbi:MAG: hypothetical protein PHP85_13305 [Gallionella sp.]|nr:hypothetical protein [Gallionella sp.]